MGGRSRKPNFSDRWDWLKELSDSRLDNYGKMSAAKFRENYTDRSKSALHNEAAAEYERRHGAKPAWHYNPHVEPASDYGSFYKSNDSTANSVRSSSKANFSTGRLKTGHDYIYTGGLNDMPLTFHSKNESAGSSSNRLWHFKKQDGEFVSLTAQQINKGIRKK